MIHDKNDFVVSNERSKEKQNQEPIVEIIHIFRVLVFT